MHASVIYLICCTWVVNSSEEKRFLATDPNYLMSEINKLNIHIQQLQQEMNALKSAQTLSGGATYVRWGKTSCPINTSVVYRGYVGGKARNSTGSGSNYLCVHETPQWGSYIDGIQGARAHLFGAEYEFDWGSSTNMIHNMLPDVDNDQTTPCVVCHTSSNREILMIPGTNQCEAGWSLEYWGYLMASRVIDTGSTEYVCVDRTADYIPGGRNQNQCLLFPVEARCGTLPCPPFVEGREMTCVVCSR